MGELRHIGADIKSAIFTPEKYEERKRHWLSTIDEENEYIVFDRIYCKHCKTEKSLDMPEHYFYIKCGCDCERKRAEQEERRRERIARAKMYQEINERTLPAEVRKASFYGIVNSKSSENYLTVCERCETFCHNFQAVKQSGRGIWLYGGFDTGKTYLAAAILKTLQSEGVLCTFTTMERILEELKATYNNAATVTEQGVMASYAKTDCLILDDFTGIKSSRKGAESWAADRFCEIIKRRYEQHLSTVITSRYSIRELATDGLLPREIVDKLVNKMVPLQLIESQRRARQQEIEF
ncbi:MAG: ATP-binding protein [Clostridia bacterium]|nr:ATP-binding protein [Clostridia bacterium]